MEVAKLKFILNSDNTLFVDKKEDIEKIGKILSCNTRIKILNISDGDITRSQINEILDLNQYTITKHVNTIVDLPDNLKLLKRIREGKKKYYLRNYEYILIAL